MQMGRALLILGLLGTAGLIATAVLGHGVVSGATDAQVRGHVLLGLAAALVLMFSHTWIVLYLLATGKVISRVVQERSFPEELIEPARRLRLRAIPWLLAALAAVAGTFLTGGAVLSGAVAGWVHDTLFVLALVLQGGAMLAERRVLAEHQRLAAELGRRMRADAA